MTEQQEIMALRRALAWYEEHAKMMRRASLQVDNQVALHILKELALDGGKRARNAMQANQLGSQSVEQEKSK